MAEGSFTANQRLRSQGSEVPSRSSFPTSAGHAEELANTLRVSATLTDPGSTSDQTQQAVYSGFFTP